MKIRDAQIFLSKYSTGVAVLTTSNRFFVVNNIQEPRVRRLFDADLPNSGSKNPPNWPWKVLASERQAKILFVIDSELKILSLSDVLARPLDTIPENPSSARKIALSPDCSRLAILFNHNSGGLLWMGKLEENQVSR